MTKKRFKNISRVFFLLFGCVLVLLIGFLFLTKESEVEIPGILSIPFMVVLVGMVLCAAIAFVLDAIESWKRDWFSFLTGYIGSVVILTAVVSAVDYFWDKQQIEILATALRVVLIISGVRAGEYVLKKEDD